VADLETLKARREELLESLANPAKSIRHGDDEVEWFDPTQLRKAIADIDTQIAAAEGRPAARIVHIRNSRGW
jgi:hypothetical protein